MKRKSPGSRQTAPRKQRPATTGSARSIGPSVPPPRRAGLQRSGSEPAGGGPRTLGELMSLALEMEMEAAQRYADLADAMDTHNNRAVAALFRKLSDIETKHAAQIMTAMAWKQPPGPAPEKHPWTGFEAPETTAGEDVHYLMQPYHALELALGNEERAERFFGQLAHVTTLPAVRKAALAMQAEEREHIALVKAWLRKTPKPSPGWAEDPDPARYTD